ncbi:FecR domain-containing protein [Massilia sp. SYSU DXS3249]
MSLRTLKTATLLALAALTNLALADDPPARVGRVALAQGQVSISTPGEAASSALVNWPVTSGNTISTQAGARSELRVGSTAIRVDGDTALEVVQLDDEQLRLRLHYGSASIRVVNADVAAGFELTTPDARVLLQGPGRVRVDAGRVADTSTVNVFDGVAIVEGGGERLTVRAGRSAEMQGNDLRTRQALADAFDEWSAVRDRETDATRATRYVTSEMTGYEDLDRHGSWRDDSEYGAL